MLMSDRSDQPGGAALIKADTLAAPEPLSRDASSASSSSSEAFRPEAGTLGLTSRQGEAALVGRAFTRRWLKMVVKYFIDPRRALHKYFVFFLAVCFIPGPYFHDTLIATYKAQICSPEGLDISSTQYAWLFGLPSMMGALSGPMASVIHTWGDARLCFVSGVLTFTAAIGVTVALEYKHFLAMLACRMAFWFGTYLLISVQMCVVYKLFTGRELAIAMGFIILGCRLGGTVGFLISGYLLEFVDDNVVVAMWVANVLVGLAMGSSVLFAWLRGGTRMARTIIPLLENGHRDSTGELPVAKSLWTEMRDFTPLTWWIVMQIAMVYAVIFPFETIETEFLEEEWGVPMEHVGLFTCLGAFFGLFSWAWGFCIPSTGGMLRSCSISWAALVASFLMMLMHGKGRHMLAAFAICVFGMAYSYLSTTTWTLIPLTFEQGKEASTGAVSVSYVIMSFGMLASQLMNGFIRDLTGGYGMCCIWFALCSLIGLHLSWKLAPGILAVHGAGIQEPLAEPDDSPTGVSEVEVTRSSQSMSSTRTATEAEPEWPKLRREISELREALQQGDPKLQELERGTQLAAAAPDPVAGASIAGGWPVAADTSSSAAASGSPPPESPPILESAISGETYFGGDNSGALPVPGGSLAPPTGAH